MLLRANELGASATRVTLMWALFSLVAALLSTPLSAMSDHFGRARVLGIAWLAYAAAYLLIGLVPGADWALWLAFALIWFVLLGRELSGGAVWAEPLSRTPEGEPFYSSHVLFYRPYVPAILGVVSGTIALLLWRSGLKNLLRDGWWCKRSQFPWLSVCAMLVYGVMS